ncbi:hypothetical protein [Nannocystis pusilla]|uniref:Uncharacterized protein n=1 Tax=Nannocystis pusilla TaxID=889268 RepID=A0ABS7TWB2_9BACT|nr:hypothetical protein [Nannocystis pusilla]MBZ5712543.1 hypothetical protein [Nannocystis pusilla]
MKPPSEDDLKDMFVVLDPPPGGLQRFRARRDARPRPRWPWWLGAGGLATATAAAALVLAPRPVAVPATPAPSVASAPAPVDLIAGRDLGALHPAWIGLGRVAPPGEPLQLAPELAGALASRRVALPRQDVVLYMLDAKEHVP